MTDAQREAAADCKQREIATAPHYCVALRRAIAAPDRCARAPCWRRLNEDLRACLGAARMQLQTNASLPSSKAGSQYLRVYRRGGMERRSLTMGASMLRNCPTRRKRGGRFANAAGAGPRIGARLSDEPAVRLQPVAGLAAGGAGAESSRATPFSPSVREQLRQARSHARDPSPGRSWAPDWFTHEPGRTRSLPMTCPWPPPMRIYDRSSPLQASTRS